MGKNVEQFARLIILGIAVSAYMSCDSSERLNSHGASSNQPTDVKSLLLAEVEHWAQGAGIVFMEDEVWFQLDSSTVLPDVAYHWAFYAPSHIDDAYLSVVGAVVADTAIILREPQDWSFLVQKSGWTPNDERDAIRGCLEAAHTVTPEVDGFVSPMIYIDPSTLLDVWVVGESLAPSVLSPPRATFSAVRSEWIVSFWAIEHRQTTLYQCVVELNRSIQLTPRDTLKGLRLGTPQ